MAHNALPANIGDLLKLGNKMVSGLTALGQTLGISQMTAATLRAQITAFTTAQTAFNTARDARQTASTACTAFHANIEEWLTKAREVLVPYLGRSWSAAWVPAGFVNHSTSVAGSVGDQLNLLGLLAAYFTANPNYDDPAVGITGAAGATLQTNSIAADATFNVAKTAATTKKDARDAAMETLTRAMRLLVGILDELLAADDPRWATFGLNIPDADTTPAAPINLTANIADGPVLLAACDAVPLATRYRWRIKVPNVDADFRLAASTKSPLAQIDKVLPGQTVELFVQAANQSAQSLPSASVTITLPALASSIPAARAAANGVAESVAGFTQTPAAAAEGNGAPRSARKPEPNGARY